MKKIIDENGRLFGRISVIDIGVLILAVVLVAAFAAKDDTTPIAVIAAPMQDVSYTVAITNMPQGRLESLHEGDTLYDSETKYALGKVACVEAEACTTSILKSDGTYVMAPVEGRYNVTVHVDAKAMVDERQNIYINRTNQIAVGLSLSLYTKSALFGGVITEIG
ncbi:MAG: DUF4330 domain-containing protein [Oscillospiraceae bacterium]|nr:DUF4330 domain-containing protein [Oscillospiraceae bacterium]